MSGRNNSPHQLFETAQEIIKKSIVPTTYKYAKEVYAPKSTTWAILHMLLLMGLGLGSAIYLGLDEITLIVTDNPTYKQTLYVVLAIGIYGSVFGIDLDKLSEDRPALLLAVTLGVLLKIVLISMTFHFGAQILGLSTTPLLTLAFAIIVAQIDPLSVSALLGNRSNLSPRAKNFIFVWSSFDDPMTVVFASAIASLGATAIVGGMSLSLLSWQNDALRESLTTIGLNLIVPLSIFIIYKALNLKNRSFIQVLLLIVAIISSAYWELILSIAILGLFLRPSFDWFQKAVNLLVPAAYSIALFILGANLIFSASSFSTSVMQGLLLAIGAITSQVIAATIFTRKLTGSERTYLRWAQQNGITAAILALYIGGVLADFPMIVGQVIGTVAIAILSINIAHMAAYWRIDKKHNL